MSARSKFTPLCAATQQEGGAHNLGIIVVRHKRTGKTYIEKRVKPDAVKHRHIDPEINVMLRCGLQPNIVDCKDYDLACCSTGYGSVYLQHAELGSLDALIGRYARRCTGLADESFVWKVLWDCSVGLAHLQTGRDSREIRKKAMRGEPISWRSGWDPIVHRDLKPSNIFLTWSDSVQMGRTRHPTVLLGDFGCAVTGKQVRAGAGAPGVVPPTDGAWIPPECPGFSDRSDVYTLGLIVMCLAARSQEPPEQNPLTSAYASKEMIKTVKNFTEYRPRDRPCVQELPALVWRRYQSWWNGRSDDGAELPSWALPG
ncbi:kinase-like protein [Ophiobolus disseminans]|uniref:non-specific serine/threonine protein kinase n=1 Tax=Ophiobolus disseminans TaxID=1469910 RepID=A0A6A7A135_9PLEO|nr:kinase-like protein [Ophiobolus disseminans]